MADGMFGDQSFMEIMQDPMTQFAISLMAQPNRGPQGQRIGFGQQLAGANQQAMQQQAAMSQMKAQQFAQQQALRKSKAEEKREAALEAFRERAAEYTDEGGEIKPKAALNLAMKLGVADPMEAIGAAAKMRRYQNVGGVGTLDTETGQFLQAPPPEFTKLSPGTMLGQRTEGGDYEPVLVNPRQVAPARAGGGRAPRMVVVPDESSPTGYAWQPATEGTPAVAPGGRTGGGAKATKGALTAVGADAATKMLETMQADIVAGEGTLSSVVGPKGAATRLLETGRGLIPGQAFSPTPALDYVAKKEIIIAQLRKTINPDPNWTKADRDNFQRLMGELETAGTAGSAVRALDGLKAFVKTLSGRTDGAVGGAPTVVRRLRNKSTGQIKIEYSDGTSEIQ